MPKLSSDEYSVAMPWKMLREMPRELKTALQKYRLEGRKPSALAARCLVNDSLRHKRVSVKSGCKTHITGHAEGGSYCITCTVRAKEINQQIEQIYGSQIDK